MEGCKDGAEVCVRSEVGEMDIWIFLILTNDTQNVDV